MIPADGGGEQLLGQDHAGALALVSAMTAEADLLEAVAGRDDPRVVYRTAEAAAEVFEDGWVPGGLRDEVIEGLVATGDDTCRGHVMAKDAAVHYLGKEGSLRDEISEQARDVLLSFGRKGLFIAGASAESDEDGARLWLRGCGKGGGHQRGDTRGRYAAADEAEKFAARDTAQFAAAMIEGVPYSSAC